MAILASLSLYDPDLPYHVPKPPEGLDIDDIDPSARRSPDDTSLSVYDDVNSSFGTKLPSVRILGMVTAC